MTHSPLSISRRFVLGDLYSRCESISDNIPVYLAGAENELLGHADEGLGHYADAFSFHLADDQCRKLSSGHFTFSFDYDHSEPTAKGSNAKIRLISIVLTARKAYEKPISKKAIAAAIAPGVS